MKRYGKDTTVIVRTVTRVVTPIILVTAFSLLLQGHNLPGGGFIGGVLTAAGVALVYIIFGIEFVQDRLLERNATPSFGLPGLELLADLRSAFSFGLAIAVGSGVAAMAFGLAFLAQDDWEYHGLEPLFEFHFASAFAFDLGVYLVVVGSLLAIISVVGSE